ncbi:MAG: hypothetical protein ACI4KB_00110, partial [Oscillospiraceae bacterium]
MKKKGISLITSLMMTASVIGGPVSQAFVSNPVTVVSAAAEKPVIGIGDSAFKGTTKISYGTKKVKIPVVITATDLCAVVMDVQVKSDKDGEADPIISDVTNGEYNVSVSEAPGSTKRIIWTTPDQENDFPKAPVLKDTVMAYVEVTLPYDSKTSTDSTYTVTINQNTLDPSDLEENADYSFDSAASDYTEKIVFDDGVQGDYTLKFAENADGKWTATDEIAVEAGEKLSVGLEIQSPTKAIGAAVYDFDITNGAKITGYTGVENFGEYLVGENLSNLVWTYMDWEGYTFKDETHLVSVEVEIPADAKPGSVYTLSVTNQDTSTAPDEVDIAPVELPSVDLVIKGEVEESDIELEIATVEVEEGTTTVDVPVYVKNGNATAIVAEFEALEGAKVVGIKEAGVVGGDIVANDAGNKVTWTNSFTTEVVDHVFPAEGESLFLVTVELPADSTVTKYPVNFIKTTTDVSNAAEDAVTVKHTDGFIIIKKNTPVETTIVTTEEPVTTTEESPVTTEAPVTTAEAPVTTEEVPVTTEAPVTT